jgi:hypothetical protein
MCVRTWVRVPTCGSPVCRDQALNAAGYSMYAGGLIPRLHYDTFTDSMLSLFVVMAGTSPRLSCLAAAAVCGG